MHCLKRSLALIVAGALGCGGLAATQSGSSLDSGSAADSGAGIMDGGVSSKDATTTDAAESAVPSECQTPDDCAVRLGPLPAECVGCAGSSDAGCAHYLCLSGICQTSYCEGQPAGSSSSKCQSPTDCEGLLGPLFPFCVDPCPGSSDAGCAHYLCLSGICQTSWCVVEPDASSPTECQAPADCEALLGPLPAYCDTSCPNAPNGGCMHYVCSAGICHTSLCM